MIGSIVLTTNQGLGYLAKAFYDNGIINKVLIHEHTSRENHREWYARQDIVSSQEELLECNTLIFFEEVWDWKIILKAREKGIKTILIPNYECTRYPFPYELDEVWCPSELDYQFYKEKGQENIKLIQIPVDVKWKLRTKALKFVHNAGNGGLGGRNGTKELIEAFRHVKSDAILLIRSQVPIKCNNPKIEVKIGTFDDIWSEGDVFVFPEKFNGLSLPIAEALSAGMLVMASKRFPNYSYLRNEPLIPVKSYRKERISVEFDFAIIDPKDIALKIDEWYGKDITEYSLYGKQWGEQNSWKNLRQKYLDMLK